MVMDENGRNGRKLHLAQQITQPVIKQHIMQLSITIFHIPRNIHMGLFITPTHNYNNLQFVNK